LADLVHQFFEALTSVLASPRSPFSVSRERSAAAFTARRIAAFASLYILINSITGLSGQIIKSGPQSLAGPASEYWPLLVAVLIGGQLGSILGMKFLTPRLLRTLTALLVGYAAIRLLWQGWGLT